MSVDLTKAQKTIGLKFKNPKLLVKALTHKSYAAEIGSDEFNERMEFLGDSILSAVVADHLTRNILTMMKENSPKLSPR